MRHPCPTSPSARAIVYITSVWFASSRSPTVREGATRRWVTVTWPWLFSNSSTLVPEENNATEGPGELHAALQRSLALNALESFTITWPSATVDECLPTLGAVINDASSILIHFDPGFVLGPVIRLNEDNPGEFCDTLDSRHYRFRAAFCPVHTH